MKELEHEEQVTVIEWANSHIRIYPELAWLFSIPNGGHRSKAQAGKLKAEGVKSGVADLCLPVARRGCNALYIEMKYVPRFKASKKGDVRVSKEKLQETARKSMSVNQKSFEKFCDAENNVYLVCANSERAITVLKWYLGEEKK